MDICAYAAHMAALLGAHIIKVKPPTAHLEQAEAEEGLREGKDRDRHAWPSASATWCRPASTAAASSSSPAAPSKGLDGLYDEVRGIRDGGGNGSIIGRNTFQRPREEALKMLDTLIKIYQGKE